ncbi:MAG: Na+:solute symporter [Candidatus Thermoplasmatota archaeon]|nr:Na+:solute symporter [Candidatus Thermoplasmatota archaeon]
MISLHPVDYFIIIWFLAIIIGVGAYFSKVASKNVGNFFVAGRSLPWWIAGTSMVATTFAADTPLAVTGLTAKYGIAGNWFWWSFVFGGVLTAIFYAVLWRRSGVITDIEFTELRYSGKPAAILRGFRSIHMGILINGIVMGWVMLAMATIFQVVLGWPKVEATILAAVLALAYTLLSGLWGIAVTDVIQFVLAMTGCVVLAIIAVVKSGGISGIEDKLVQLYGEGGAGQILSFIPDPSSIYLPIAMFLTYIGLNWYATWYPGAEPGGGGYVAQRMFSCKSEKDSKLAVIWFTFAHYVIRPWPWILVALVSLVTWPNLENPEMGYPMAMSTFLPVGLRGLIIAAFLAAFMSTMASQISLGSSYIVNDFYMRFIKNDASKRHYVGVARIVSVIQLVIAIVIAFMLQSVANAWQFLVIIGSGTGLVYLLRWFWWRINAWSEISAMAAAAVVGISSSYIFPGNWVAQMWLTFASVTAVWTTVTLLTEPEKEETLIGFYRKLHPAGFWSDISKKSGVAGDRITASHWISWAFGVAFILCSLFGIGKIILGEYDTGILLATGAAVSFLVVYGNIMKEPTGQAIKKLARLKNPAKP